MTSKAKPAKGKRKPSKLGRAKKEPSRGRGVEAEAIEAGFLIPRGPGRPPKLTPALQQKVRDAIATGSFIETACSYAGIHRDTLHDWLRRGAAQASGKYRQFSDAIGEAMAIAEVSKVARMTDLSAQTEDLGVAFRATAFWLERARRKNWGRTERVELGGIPSGDGGTPIPLGVTVYLPAEDDEG